MEELESNLIELITSLKVRGNNAYVFFEKALKQIEVGDLSCFDSILGASTIVQYGDFTYKEEALFGRIWYLTDMLKNTNLG